MKGKPCSLITVSTPLGMGEHWGLTAKYPVVLGFHWLIDHDPLVQWGGRIINFQDPKCKDHGWNPTWDTEPKDTSDLAGLSAEEKALIPPPYHDLMRVFEEWEANELPPHQSTDCAIELILGGKLPKAKLYVSS